MAPSSPSSRRPRAFLDVAVGSAPSQRLVFELRPDVAPRTCANFLALCSGERRAKTNASGDPLWFQGTAFHRIIPGFMMQGGDTTAGDGTGGSSIYGPTFDDEAFILKHDGAGVLSSANAGPHTNSSQFFVLFGDAPWLDGKHVVFGKVVEGMESVVRAAEKVGTKGGAPRQRVVVVGCGVVGASSASAAAAALPAAAAAAAAPLDDDLDGDDASRARLRRLRGEREGEGASGVVSAKVPVRTAQDELREEEAANERKEAEEEEAAAAAAEATTTDTEGEEARALREEVERGEEREAAVAPHNGAPPPPPPTTASTTNPRAAKLELLRSKLAASRKANAGAVIAEKRREAAAAVKSRREADEEDEEGAGGGGNGGAGGAPGFKAWSREAAAERAAECARLGIPLNKSHLLDRADAAEARLEKKKRAKGGFYKAETDDSAQESVAAAAAYERRMAQLPTATLAPSGTPTSSSASAAASLAYGGVSRDSKEAVDRMASELAAEGAAARARKIQRGARAGGSGGGGSGGDVDAISRRNEDFNRKLGAKYGAAAAEIRANLERGTALPDNN